MSEKWTKPEDTEAEEMRKAMEEQAAKAAENDAIRRAAERVALKAQVTVSSETNFFTGLSENISEGGVFISSLAPPEIGTIIDAEISTGEAGQAMTNQFNDAFLLVNFTEPLVRQKFGHPQCCHS